MEIWPYIPQRGVTESLEWLTDVVRCKAGEDRVSIRLNPRQGFQFSSLLDQEEYSRAKILSRGLDGEFESPLWPHLVNTGDLAISQNVIDGEYDPDLYSGAILVWQDSSHWERREVTSTVGGLVLDQGLSNNYYNALVVPLQVVTLAQTIDFKSTNGNMWTSDIRVVSVAALELLPLSEIPSHRGHDILLDPNILLSQLSERHYRELSTVDSQTGPLAVFPRYSFSESRTTMSWKPIDRQELREVLGWVHARRGKRKDFWYMSHNEDLVATSSLQFNATGSDRIEVSEVVGLSLPLDLCITHRSTGQRLFYSVSSMTDLGSTTRLILSGNKGVTWLPSQVSISLMYLVRFDSDRVEIKHTHGGAAALSIPLVEVPQ